MLEKISIAVIAGVIGAIITHFWSKFKNRMTVLKYFVWHQHLGGAIDDPNFGSIKLFYNDNQIKNLYLSKITITNDYNKDLSNLELNVVADPASIILVAHGFRQASLNILEFTEKYQKEVENKNTNMNVMQRRDFKLPVLNREDRIDINLLITNLDGKQPFIKVSCDYPGIIMKLEYQPNQLFGEPRDQSVIIGILIALILCFPLIYITKPVISIYIAVIFGMLAALFGVLTRKVCKFIIKILS